MAIVSTGTCHSPPSVSNDNCWFLMVMRFDRLYGEAVNEKLCNGRYCGCNLRARTMVQLGWKYTRIFKELSVLLVPYECMPSPCTFSTLFLCLIESVTVQQKMWAFPFDIWVFLQSGLRGLSFPFQKGQEHCAHMAFKQHCKPIASSFLEDFVLIIVLEFVATMQSCCRSTWRKWGGTWQVPAFSSGLYSGIL
jgi:hypothetical protein